MGRSTPQATAAARSHSTHHHQCPDARVPVCMVGLCAWCVWLEMVRGMMRETLRRGSPAVHSSSLDQAMLVAISQMLPFLLLFTYKHALRSPPTSKGYGIVRLQDSSLKSLQVSPFQLTHHPHPPTAPSASPSCSRSQAPKATMEDERMQRLHDTLEKLRPRGKV